MKRRKDMLGLRGVERADIEEILDTAEQMREISRRKVKKVPTLRGRTVVTLFFENSTRTRTSFDLAAKRLSADTLGFSVSTSSTTKGETLMDTARTIYAMSPDAVVVRHACAGAPHLLARHFPWTVLNAGDGINEHPSQALLDMLTMRDRFAEIDGGGLEGRKVAIVGDVQHSRVARSNIFGLTTMGAKVLVAGPGTMCRSDLAALPVEIRHTVDDVVAEADVIMMLRIQRERLGRAVLPSAREYAAFYGLDLDRLKRARPDVVVMHPGPINRGVEIAADVADGPNSVILDQVTNGIAVRMALLFLLLGNADDHAQAP
ncbi:MAG: aspartate carbamoyltransferase catalytic subunit [Pseudomonadota bacterium]|nr:aspartate carbamoyltransferase catalytic subunit [Pseudomonadota bacterium]